MGEHRLMVAVTALIVVVWIGAVLPFVLAGCPR